jgi:hypothetical protein
MNDTTLDPASARALTEYLKFHEDDIAHCINDFGCLDGLFKHVFLHPPRKAAPDIESWLGV